MNLRDWTLRLRALVMPRRVERDLHDELSFHIERETKKLIDEGMEPARARDTAQARFGSTTVAADECRDERGTAFVDNTIRDVHYALRTFRRAPLAAITIVVTVAIGLGVVAVLFTILNMFLFRVDTVPDITEMYAVERPQLANGDRSLLTRPRFEALRRETSVFTDAYAALPDIDLRVDGQMMAVTLVSGNFFQVVGVNRVMGRALAPSDDERSGGNPVVVLSDKGWDRRFNRDPNVLGRTVLVSGAPFEIIGVMPAGFRGLEVSAPDFWAPLSLLAQFRPGHAGNEDSVGVDVVGRLKPGVSMESARAQLSAWDSNQQIPTADRRAEPIMLLPRRGTLPQPMEAIAVFTPLFFAFGLILMIGCANVANLLLARGVARQREIGIRLSLGASRRRIVRQLMTESWLLALAAAAGGYFVSRVALEGTVYWVMRDDAGGSRRHQSQRARRRLARRAVPGHRGDGRDGVLRVDARAAGHPDRAGADAARRTGEGRASRPRPQCADRHPGLRVGAVADLRRDLPAQRDRVIAIRSGPSHRRHRGHRHHQ